jgi:hypothetical protein
MPSFDIREQLLRNPRVLNYRFLTVKRADLRKFEKMEINEFKPVIRSILLALGRRATVQEFLKEFKDTEGCEFKEVLDEFKMSLSRFIESIPDVCRVKRYGEEIYIERVSTEDSSHMDRLTIVKKKKKVKSCFG